jgi:hypothetical protein
MRCKYQIIGTYNNIGCGAWRWAWGNIAIPDSLKKLSIKMMNYSHIFRQPSFYKNIIKAKRDWKEYFVYASLLDKHICGYLVYRNPNTKLDVYIVLMKCGLPSNKPKSKKRNACIKISNDKKKN